MTTPFFDIEKDLSGAEDMSCVQEREVDTAAERHFTVVIQRDELSNGHIGILSGVERFDGRKTLFCAFLGNELGVGSLDFGRIFEHDAGEIPCGESAVDIAGETLSTQVGQVAGVIDVSVAEDDGVDIFGIEREGTVPFDGLGSPPLVEAAFEKDFAMINLQEIHRPGGGPDGTVEGEIHAPIVNKSERGTRMVLGKEGRRLGEPLSGEIRLGRGCGGGRGCYRR